METPMIREYVIIKKYKRKDGSIGTYSAKARKVIKKPVSHNRITVLAKNITDMKTLLELEQWLIDHQPPPESAGANEDSFAQQED